MKITSRFATALVIALGVGVAGCGSDDDSSEPSNQQQQKSIIETAQAAGSFTTLVTAVEAAGLVETLSGPGPFTVFAPTDDAFAKLPAGTVDTLLKPENKQALADILTYHVVSGDVRADTVVTLSSAKTVNGADVSIKVNGRLGDPQRLGEGRANRHRRHEWRDPRARRGAPAAGGLRPAREKSA